MDLILHDPAIQELEALLRSLKLLVERTDPRETSKFICCTPPKKNCWIISNSRRKSPKAVSINTSTPVGTGSLAANRLRR
ncbi:Uncharacterized protein conserved in bacteria [Salmonella enterica subsp. enterica serovar Sanjuan]|uniref:Uncharacterized protein conserved in bacteria n=1 Tax=Salmonella enterica subsp. enterica serovar Sanjuan TaxID=1160765 RepID=A0A3S4EPL4_SALET|nr:Uncharacterized protein conserved in bacteria [Salmonella enterica subsp. enterica serovar Sanjuan]